MNIFKNWGVFTLTCQLFSLDNYKPGDVFYLFFYHFLFMSLKVNLHRTFPPQTKFKQEWFPIVQLIIVVNGLSSETTLVLLVFTSSRRFRELRSEYKTRSTSVHFLCANMF